MIKFSVEYVIKIKKSHSGQVNYNTPIISFVRRLYAANEHVLCVIQIGLMRPA